MRGDRSGRRGDAGHLQVLEAMLVTLALLGAAYAVVSFRLPANETERPRANLERVANDALVVLSGLNEPRGNLLDLGVEEWMHCRLDPVPNASSCFGGKGSMLSFRLESYLPAGAGYAILLDNGVEHRELHRSLLPAGEAVSASYSYQPDWNLTYILPQLSCYGPMMDVNATMIAIRHGAAGNLTSARAKMDGGTMVPATAFPGREGWWNVSLPLSTRPAKGNISADVTAKRGSFPGLAYYDACDLRGQGNATVNALGDVHFVVAAANATAPLGTTVQLDADLNALDAVMGVEILSANITIYEPIPTRPGEADTYAPAAVLPLTLDLGRASVNWTLSHDSLWGVHPVALRAQIRVSDGSGSTTLEARIPATITVALPSGVVPIEAPYRVLLQIWMPDWQ